MIKGVSAPLRFRKTGLQLLLLILIILAGNITVTAQTGLLGRKFTCHETHGTIPFLLERVSAYSGTVIEYAGGYLDGSGEIRLAAGVATLDAVLHILLDGKYVKIEERNGKVMLVPSATALTSDSATNEYTLFGYIMEENSLEPIPYAMIKDQESGRVCQSNRFGYYSLPVKSGLHHIKVIHAGYPPVTSAVTVGSTIRRNLMMRAAVLPEVKVTPGCMLQKDGGSSVEKYLASAYTNFFGESDPVRSLYLLPGNIESQETTGKLMVRGGDPEQSAFLLDGNQVFNPTHLLGELSIVSEGALKSIRQFKNDFPGRFDDALSSVTEVNTKDGSMDTWSGQVNAGLLATAMAVDGPLIKNRTAVLASVRKSWSDPLLRMLDSNYRLRFYDIHFKITHLLDSNNKIMLSGYMGKDRLELVQNEYQNLQVWGNRLATLNWNHVIGARSFVNTTLNVSNYHNLAGMQLILYDDSTGEEKETKAYNNYASVERYEARTQFEMNASANLQFRFGGKFLHTVIHPFGTNVTPNLEEVPEGTKPMKPLPFTEYSLYYENEFKPGRRFLLRPGLLFSGYRYRTFHYNALQPRLFAAYRIGKNQQLTFSYARMGQYLHQVTSPFLGINSVLWVPSTAVLRPSESDMFNLGYSFNDNKGTLISADIYYRKMNNVTNFAEKGNIFYNEDTWEQDIITGKGWGYGGELLAGKRWQKWQLQLSYTLAWAWRQFDEVNDGEKFPFRFDRRHQLNITASFRPNKHWDIGAVWYFSTGDWMRRPMGTLPGEEGEPFRYEGESYYDKRNPNYHRLNCNVNYRFVTGTQKHKISVGVYNAYGSNGQYSSDVINTRDNSNVTLSGGRIFDLTYYLSYTLNL